MKKFALATSLFALLSPEAFSQNYYVESKSYGSRLEPEPPQYVRTLSETKIESLKKIDWIDVGLQYRVRFEDRDNDFTRSIDNVDTPIFSRTRAYFGVKKILDPFRLTLEFQDSRKSHSRFASSDSETNKLEFLQSYGELFFKDALGYERPISIRYGRMSFGLLDKRLVDRNGWRNTTNNFQGFRAIFGQNKNDWQLDTFALQTLNRPLERMDHRNNDQWLYGAVGNWRRWSKVTTLQPFYFRFDQKKTALQSKKEIHSTGLRSYGVFGNSNFDYDFSGTVQFGRNNNQKQRAFGSVAEIGYNFKHSWKPRLSENYVYGSGDKNPNDNKDQRFDRLFGASNPITKNDYFQWENINAVKTRIEFEPNQKLRVDSGYSFYWLASSTDRWNKGNLRDNTGSSGNFLGQEFDSRIRYKFNPNLDSAIGYVHFKPGEFTRKVGRNNASDFLYLELTWSLF